MVPWTSFIFYLVVVKGSEASRTNIIIMKINHFYKFPELRWQFVDSYILIEVMICSTLRILNFDRLWDTWLRLGRRNTDLRAFCWTGFNLLRAFLLVDQTIAAKFKWLSKIEMTFATGEYLRGYFIAYWVLLHLNWIISFRKSMASYCPSHKSLKEIILSLLKNQLKSFEIFVNTTMSSWWFTLFLLVSASKSERYVCWAPTVHRLDSA